MRTIPRIVNLLAILLAGSQCASRGHAEWLTWDGSPEGTPPEVAVIASDAASTTFEVVIHGVFMEVVEGQVGEETIQFSRILLPRDAMSNWGTTMSAGKAELPVIRRYIAVLSDAETAQVAPDGYDIDEEAVEVLNDVVVYPLQSLSSEEYPGSEFDYDEKFYTSGILYPIRYDEPPTLSFEISVFHHLRVARVELYPFVTIPGDRSLWVYRRFQVRMDHAGQGQATLFPRAATYDRMYSGLVANYETVKPLLPAPQQGQSGSYLILAADEFYSNVMPLATWKMAKGLGMTIRTVPSQVPNTAEDIQGEIKAFYEDHREGDVFVLLVGDVDKVTSATCQAYEWNELRETCSSDVQYARVAGEDAIPDLFLGRIPADSLEHVDTMVKKILDYEMMSAEGEKDWLGKALLIAHKQGYPGGYADCKEVIRDYPYSLGTPAFDTLYGGEGATNSQLKSVLEDGRGIVNYRGHGGADCWSAWGLSGQSWCISPDVVGLMNGPKTPIVFSITSLTNRISSNDCMGEVFVNQAERGTVAFYGASADTGRAANDRLDKNLFKAIFDEGIEALGAAVNWAQVRTMEEAGGAAPLTAEYNSNLYLLLGDPEMSVRTRAPESFGEVKHPVWVESGAQTIEVEVKNMAGEPVPGALVIVRKYTGPTASPDVNAGGYTIEEGTASFSISPMTRGGLSVTVLKQDYAPYVGDGPVRVIHTEGDIEDGSFSFSWQIEPGRSYAVYVADELVSETGWQLLGISPKRDGLTMTLTDPTAALVPQRFYRIEPR